MGDLDETHTCNLDEIMLHYTRSLNLDDSMYDDYDLDYSSYNDANLDEDMYLIEEEDYARDGHDYESLAYKHYA